MTSDERLAYRLARAAWSLGFGRIEKDHVRAANAMLDERDREAVRERRRQTGATFRIPVAMMGDER